MVQLVSKKVVRSKKEHTCNYCGKIIEPGMLYIKSFVKNGDDVYSWKSHQDCQCIVDKLDDYFFNDYYNGISSDDFIEGIHQFCKEFVCPKCKFIDIDDECALDNSPVDCIQTIAAVLRTHKLCRVKQPFYDTLKLEKVDDENDNS